MIFKLPDAIEEGQSPAKPKFGIGKLHLLHMCTILKLSQRLFGGFIASFCRNQTLRYLGSPVSHGHDYGYGYGTSLAIKAMWMFPSNCSSDSYQKVIWNQLELLLLLIIIIIILIEGASSALKPEITRNSTQSTMEMQLETASFPTSLFEESNEDSISYESSEEAN